MRSRLIALSIATLSLTLGVVPAQAQFGKLKKMKEKVEKEVNKAMGPDTTGKKPASTPAGNSAPAATPSSSRGNSGNAGAPMSSNMSEPSRGSGRVESVRVYPGATLAGQDHCCAFTSSDPIAKIVAFYDQEIGTKGRTLDEMAAAYPIWQQQAAAYRPHLKGGQMFVWLLQPGNPTGRQISVMENVSAKQSWWEIPPALVARGAPRYFAQYITNRYNLKPTGNVDLDPSTDMRFASGPQPEAPERKPDPRVEAHNEEGITQGFIDRLIAARKAIAPIEARQAAAEQKANQEVSAQPNACMEKLTEILQRDFLAQGVDQTDFPQRFCAAGMVAAAPGEDFDGQIYEAAVKFGEMYPYQIFGFFERFSAFATQYEDNPKDARVAFANVWTKAEMALIEKNFARIKAVMPKG